MLRRLVDVGRCDSYEKLGRKSLACFDCGPEPCTTSAGNQFHRRPAPVASPYGDGSKRQRTEQPKPPCAFFRVGRCAKGANCPYAHEDGEVAEDWASGGNSWPVTVAVPVERKVPQVVPPPADRPVSRRSPAPVPTDDSSTMFKRTLCKFFLNGCCVNGEMCTFAHGEHELQQPAEGGTWVFIPSTAPTAPTKMGSSWGALALASRKTQLCAYFEAGSCKKGAACNFAHGSSELEPRPRFAFVRTCMRLLTAFLHRFIRGKRGMDELESRRVSARPLQNPHV
ncbi:unnamed protein product [Symbiodinium sp. CCMP2456]|nr:unnamed protein product [Symbiodinium sp. CCMP2456]